MAEVTKEDKIVKSKNIIENLKEEEKIYFEGTAERDYNEIICMGKIVDVIKNAQSEKKDKTIRFLINLDVCNKMMHVIAKDCIKLLNQSDILGEGDEINKGKLEEYLISVKEDANRYKNMEKADQNRVFFLDKYAENNYDKYINRQNKNDLKTIMDQRAIEEFGANIISYDPDVSLVTIYIYCKLLQTKYFFKEIKIKEYKSYKYEIYCNNDENMPSHMLYRGDAMTSWWTSLKAYLPISDERKKYFSNKNECQSFLKIGSKKDDISNAVKKFMKAVYTIGNFCPVPEGFNGARSNFGSYDYWDLTLMKIREWYLSIDSKFLYERDNLIQEDLLLNTGNPLKCLRWLESFGQGQIGWHNFVDTLYMQDYVYNEDNRVETCENYKRNKDDEKYYDVISFWEGHKWSKEGIKFPTGDDEIKNAFETMTAMINARTKRIAEALVNAKK